MATVTPSIPRRRHDAGDAHLSPKDLARAIGMSESSLKRWVDAGLITVQRTAGGHRRIPMAEAVRFVRSQGHRLVDARPFGFRAGAPAGAGDGQDFMNALTAGDVTAARDALIGRYLAGDDVATLCDGPVHRAMRGLGELWRDADPLRGECGIAIEHQASGICLELFAQLRSLIGHPPAGAPVSLGCAPEGDPYQLPGVMAAATLADAGYASLSLGPETPYRVLEAAIASKRPRLVWVAVSTDKALRTARHALPALAARLAERDIALVVGGPATNDQVFSAQPLLHAHTLGELNAIGRALR